ncbi:MAG: carbon monoxide dehydrogenase, partial [Planctomycetota bacterium]|nr:carbon monoxide dehydrogenase [Planctomycetota bacterium]
RTIGAAHTPFDETRAYECAKDFLKRACENYRRRDLSKMAIPKHKRPLVAGFSVPAIKYMLGGSFRASFRPLNDAIIQNRILGVVG